MPGIRGGGLNFSTVSQRGYGVEEPDPQVAVELESDDTGDGDEAQKGEEVTKSMENKEKKTEA